MHGVKCTGALNHARSTARPATTASIGSAVAVALLAGCAGGTPEVDYLNAPTRVQPPSSDAANRAYDDPVYPTNTGTSAIPHEVCDLVPAAEVEQVTGVPGVSATPESQILCSYQAGGRAVFRLTLYSYPHSTEPAAVLEVTVSPYGATEATPGLGDASAYVPDTGEDLPPALFVAQAVDNGVAMLKLAFDDRHPDPKDQLIALGEVAAAAL